MTIHELEDAFTAQSFMQLKAERERARRLAAKLEEIVAARSLVLEALVGWRERRADLGELLEICDWAAAQLEQIP